jgi:dTDP-4-dehydrorhamnose reductase
MEMEITMELWAGIECTVNRVGDRYFDQSVRNGHDKRVEDLDRFAGLGIKAIRYPVLWERTAPDGLHSARWTWTDERLGRLRELGVRPIVGLLHHGSGPPNTSLIDRDLPERLAEYALAVAKRYPWVSAYTPVNEPLTTARFSGLYGYWYPHGRDTATFLRTLLGQCRAVVLAMQAIRSVNPTAELIQTEDFGVTYSTTKLSYQADLENHRRLLSLDLLTGQVNPHHPLWDWIVSAGIPEKDLTWFLNNPCAPDIIGMNYYLTSDRLLDERMERYPIWSHGGNGRDQYADIEAVRVWQPGISGFGPLLSRLWKRYGRTVAITEVHLGCTREEQLRWLMEAWNDCQEIRLHGVDVRAVTVWSLLGAFDWNRLVVEENGFYEPGVYDLRGPEPRPTALAAMMQALATGRRFNHPVLETRGWWRLPSRLHYPPVGGPISETEDEPNRHHSMATTSAALHTTPRGRVRPLVILGANGTLGRAFTKIADTRGLACRAFSRHDVDIADAPAVLKMLEECTPWAVVNAAGYVRVDDAEADCEVCLRVNTTGAATVAAACGRRGVKLLTFSSDLVFDGARDTPYMESHAPGPLSVYGRSKAEAERQVFGLMPTALVVRTSAFFGPWDDSNFVTMTMKHLSEGRPVRVSRNVVSPTYVPDLVHAGLDLLIDGERGVWHLANEGTVTWGELARKTAAMANMDAALVEDCDAKVLGLIAPRPLYSALGTERGALLPSLEDSLQRYIVEWRRQTSESFRMAGSRTMCQSAQL